MNLFYDQFLTNASEIYHSFVGVVIEEKLKFCVQTKPNLHDIMSSDMMWFQDEFS